MEGLQYCTCRQQSASAENGYEIYKPLAGDLAAFFQVCADFQGSTYMIRRSFALTGRFDASETVSLERYSIFAGSSGMSFWGDRILSLGDDSIPQSFHSYEDEGLVTDEHPRDYFGLDEHRCFSFLDDHAELCWADPFLIEKRYECTTDDVLERESDAWCVAGCLFSLLAHLREFWGISELSKLYINGFLLFGALVGLAGYSWENFVCMKEWARGRRLCLAPPLEGLSHALGWQILSLCLNFSILEFDVCAEGDDEGYGPGGLTILVFLCRVQGIHFLILGLLYNWRTRRDERMRLPTRARWCRRRYVWKTSRNTATKRWIACFMLLNLLGSEAVGISTRLADVPRGDFDVDAAWTEVQQPFRPYEVTAAEGDISRFEGYSFHLGIEANFEENSRQHAGSGFSTDFLSGDCAPGDRRANSVLCAVHNFEPDFAEWNITFVTNPIPGERTSIEIHVNGDNTATLHGGSGLCVDPDVLEEDAFSLMHQVSDLRRSEPFAIACERGRPLRPALQLSRRVFTPIWLHEGRDIGFEFFRTAQGVWQKKVLGWKFLTYEQDLGAPFSIHLLQRGLWAAQLITPFEDEDVLMVYFLVVTPQPIVMFHVEHDRGMHDTVVLAMDHETFVSDRIHLVIQYARDGTLVQDALRCPVACSPVMICVALGLGEQCQDPQRVRAYFRLEQTERVFWNYERIGLPNGAFVHLSLHSDEEGCVVEPLPQLPLREHEMLLRPETDHHNTVWELETDQLNMMQVSPPTPDLVTRYIAEFGAFDDTIGIVSWLHMDVVAGRTASIWQRARYSHRFPGGLFIRGLWDRALRLQSCHVFPVRPAPVFAEGPVPNFIVTNFEGDNFIPALLMYVTETDRKLFTFVFQVRRWPTVLEVFDMTIPAHGCVWDSDCSIRMGPYTDERNLVWDMQVVMYEGAYLRLQEYRRDEIAVPVALDPQTTCGETESGSSSDGSDSWTSDSTSDVPENNLNATGDTEEHGEGTELQQYEFSLMQYEWELEMAKDEADFLAGVRALPGASFDEVRYPEMLHLTVQKEIGDGLAIDVFQRYLRIHCPVHELSTFTVHVWIVDHEIAAFARVLPLFAGRSMTDSMRRELQHVDESESFWISALDPMPLPLSLRICPLDLVVLSAKQKKDHKRIYVVDILFRSLPRRVALIYHCGERLQDLVRRAGLQEACTPRRHHCTLSKTTTFQVKVWQLHEIVDERHGTSFELRFHDKKEAEICTPEETALMQQPASDPRAVRSIGQYLRFWNFVDREFTVWYHGNHDIKVQEHPWVLDSVSRLALRRQLQEMQIGDEDDVVPVNPPPVFVAVGRPHVLIIGGGKATKIPIQCQTFYERRVNLMSILIDGSYPPLSIAAIFETAHPAHECEDSQRCYAVYENRMIPYYADVDLQEGAFIKLYRRDADDEEPSTECPSDASEVSDDSEYLVDLPYVGEQLQPQPDRDNTATLVGYSSQHLLEETARNDYVSLFHSGIHQRRGRLDESSNDEDRIDLGDAVRRHVRQRHDMLRVGRLTTFDGFPFLEAEARAFRESRGVWPDLVICGLVHDVIGYWEVSLEDQFLFLLDELRHRLRQFIEPPIRPREQISFAAVKPLPTTLEQQGEDDLYVLVGTDLRSSDRLALIALWDFRYETVVEMHPMVLPLTMLRDTLLQLLGLEERCGLAFIDCLVTYDSQELPRLVAWRTIQGMKIVVEVHLRRCPNFAAWFGIFAGESRLQLPDDEETMLMQHPPVERGCAQHSVAGLGKLTLLEHRVRMQRDLIYELLALRQDQFGLTPFEGALTSFWLLPGLERAAQMIEKKLLLHVVAADWTQWIEHCWEQKPEASQFYLIRQHVPSASRENSVYHVIGTSQEDRTKGLQTVLIDLTYSNIRHRGVIRYNILATVVELVVLFVGAPIRIHHGILEDFELHWYDGQTVHVFRSMETVAIPNAVFVHIVPRGKPLPQICEQEQFRFDSDGELILMQMESHLTASRVMRDLEDPLHRLIIGRRSQTVRDRVRICLWKLDGATSYAELDSPIYELTQEIDNWSEHVEPDWRHDGRYLFSFVHPQRSFGLPCL